MNSPSLKSDEEDSSRPQCRKKRPRASSDEYTNPTFIFDIGAHSTKLGYSTDSTPRVIPNCVMKVKSERRRLFIGDQIDDCRNLSGLFYILPMSKGYILNWDVQKRIWDYMFGSDCCNVRFQDTTIVMTEPMFNFTSIREATNEIFFEEYGVPSLFKSNPTDFAAYNYLNGPQSKAEKNMNSCVVVDSGFSFTHVVPYLNKKKYWNGVKRIDVGGKLLTNHLKEIISYRQLNVMDETHVINQAKEDSCFVSTNFQSDMQTAGRHGQDNTIIREYVLPDYSSIKRGYIQMPREVIEQKKIDDDDDDMHQQTLRMNIERFTVPEILFRPSDIGLQQQGIAETVITSIHNCPDAYHAFLVKNIVVGGGNVKFQNFATRLARDLRSLCSTYWDCFVKIQPEPLSFAWSGAAKLCKDPNFPSMCATRQDYEEYGNAIVEERFNNIIYNCPLQADLCVVKPQPEIEVQTDVSPMDTEQQSTNIFESSSSGVVSDINIECPAKQAPKQVIHLDKELKVSIERTDISKLISKRLKINIVEGKKRIKKPVTAEQETELNENSNVVAYPPKLKTDMGETNLVPLTIRTVSGDEVKPQYFKFIHSTQGHKWLPINQGKSYVQLPKQGQTSIILTPGGLGKDAVSNGLSLLPSQFVFSQVTWNATPTRKTVVLAAQESPHVVLENVTLPTMANLVYKEPTESNTSSLLTSMPRVATSLDKS